MNISYLRTIFDNMWENTNHISSTYTNSRFNNNVTSNITQNLAKISVHYNYYRVIIF